jgi:hypothetical protein
LNSTEEIFFGLAENQSADVNFLVLPLVVVLVTALMAALALPLGPLLKSMPPLRAYAIDIGGSMAGIAAFAALAAVGSNPLIWFSIAAVLLLLLELGRGIRVWSGVAAVAIAASIYFVAGAYGGDVWSPYYRIRTFNDQVGKTHIMVNGIPHQAMWPLTANNKEPFYEQVFRWFPDKTYENVLIVGAGSGTDTAIHLARGAGHIDAWRSTRASSSSAPSGTRTGRTTTHASRATTTTAGRSCATARTSTTSSCSPCPTR